MKHLLLIVIALLALVAINAWAVGLAPFNGGEDDSKATPTNSGNDTASRTGI